MTVELGTGEMQVGTGGCGGGGRGRGGGAGKAPVEGRAGEMVGETAGEVVVKRAFGSVMTVEAVMVVAWVGRS